jgi:hypothetical protein
MLRQMGTNVTTTKIASWEMLTEAVMIYVKMPPRYSLGMAEQKYKNPPCPNQDWNRMSAKHKLDAIPLFSICLYADTYITLTRHAVA